MSYRTMIVCSIGLLCLLPGRLPAADYTTDSLQTVRENLLQKKALLIDVRAEKEWKQGHVLGAIHLPVTTLDKIDDNEAILKELAAVLEQQMPKDRILYTHCVSGPRALKAGEILAKMGYEVRPLEAGYRDLIQAGFPDGREKPKE